MLEFIDLGPLALEALRQAVDTASAIALVGCSVPEGNVALLAPIPRPRKNIFGIGLNYTEHVAESARALDTSDQLPKQPVIFSKPPTAVVSWNDPIRHNAKVTQQLDWETELAVVIGQTAHHVDEAGALDYVFGYTVINDVSARDCRRAGQWIVSKGQDSFAPMGPCIVTRDEIPDPHNLNLWTRVNGVEKQNSNTRFMLFNVNQLIADISSVMTLEPGDIIATGTPAGVGAGRTPPEFMWPGDVVECHVEGIGSLRNPIVAVQAPT
jgi:2-keto-4-pentenoate hydratase/2-oxohepta-3-ene-1,7-dioic acid hydratase in catechol pathway